MNYWDISLEVYCPGCKAWYPVDVDWTEDEVTFYSCPICHLIVAKLFAPESEKGK